MLLLLLFLLLMVMVIDDDHPMKETDDVHQRNCLRDLFLFAYKCDNCVLCLVCVYVFALLRFCCMAHAGLLKSPGLYQVYGPQTCEGL
ncbi:hypothetical protein BDB00DRAFT_822339, partial [Zychaea mexicana]|uniref:uncharacterized protein n=1 Tax=Zychaea mexicana TaxID=64656 RepID=UPI0022FDD99E